MTSNLQMNVAEELNDMLPIVFMFSGQGSQFYHMGQELYEQNKNFSNWMNELDALIKEEMGESVLKHIYNPENKKSEVFDNILLTHPAIFMMGYSMAQVLIESGIKPDYLLGSSLGEVTATAVAEALPLESAVRSVVKQASILDDKCSPGGMLAILSKVELYDNDPVLNEQSEMAAENFHSHFVVSSDDSGLKSIENHLSNKDIIFQRLPVNRAFHSSYINDAKEEFERHATSLSMDKPTIPFVSCVTAGVLDEIESDYFWKVARNPIQTANTIRTLEKTGDYVYVDLGPSGTLSNFVKYNLGENDLSQSYPILTPFGRDLKGLSTFTQMCNSYSGNGEKHTFSMEKKMKVFVFPGQGSQWRGMGEDLFEELGEYTQKANEILGYSIKELCQEDPNRQLSKTEFTQPALYVVNALSFIKRTQDSSSLPDYLAGHSLGEYSALFAAGAFDFETGLKLVKKRGELMSQATGGGMAAILGCDAKTIENVIADNGLDCLDIANYNSPVQTVISGTIKQIGEAQPFFEKINATYIPLNVSAPFHSRYMQPVMEEFEKFLMEFQYSPLKIPVIANVSASPYEDGDVVRNLKEQLCGSVRWTDSIRYLKAKGEFEFEEIGPGDVLTKLIDTIVSEK